MSLTCILTIASHEAWTICLPIFCFSIKLACCMWYKGCNLPCPDSSFELGAKWKTPFSSRVFSSVLDWGNPKFQSSTLGMSRSPWQTYKFNFLSPDPHKNQPSKYLGFLKCLPLHANEALPVLQTLANGFYWPWKLFPNLQGARPLFTSNKVYAHKPF